MDIILTPEEKERFVAWIIAQARAHSPAFGIDNLVPADEGHADGLLYNLIHWVLEGSTFERYAYRPEQDAEIAEWLGEP